MNPGEPLSSGHLLDGRYRINKVLGQGGMGRVYLANDTRLANRPVAAKEMVLGDGIQEKKAIEDFNREAKVLASLSHPSIPQVIDFFVERGRHYLVMEYVAGADLQHRLDKLGPNGKLPENQVLVWSRQILDVLHFLHSQKPPLIYRDLKPGNIMIDKQERAMLIDFGIARFLPPGGRGTQIGSVGYAPPEQYLGKLEPRSDLYALAATMHHLLTGRDPQLEPPFSFPPVRQLAPMVSAMTENVIMRALSQEIEKRPGSAREMHRLLPNPDAPGVSHQGSAGSAATPGHKSAGIGQMATIVLDRPMTASRAPTPPSLKQSVPSSASSGAKTKRSLTPLAKPAVAQAAASATAKTRDLGLKAKNAPSQPSQPRAAAGPVRTVSPPIAPRMPIKAPIAHVSASAKAEVSRQQRTTIPAQNGTTTPHAKIEVPPAAAWLIVGSDGMRFGLVGNRMVIGRMENGRSAIDIDLSKLRQGAERVSHRHAEIIKQGSDFFVRDLGSLNGTYVAGRGRLSRDQLYKLRDRDELVLGGTKLEFRKG